jgi:hypothetical protein
VEINVGGLRVWSRSRCASADAVASWETSERQCKKKMKSISVSGYGIRGIPAECSGGPWMKFPSRGFLF